MHQPASLRPRKLSIESLEARALMTASAVVDAGGNLTIHGDSGGNFFRLLEIAPSHWMVSAELGSLNGVVGGRYEARGVTGNITVELFDGNDRLDVGLAAGRPVTQQAMVNRNLTIRDGAGYDIVNVSNVTVHGRLNVNTGKPCATDAIPADEVGFDQVRCDEVNVRMAGAINHFNANRSRIGQLNLDMGHATPGRAGNNFVKLQNTRIAAIDATFAGIGTDQIQLFDGSRIESGSITGHSDQVPDSLNVSHNSRIARTVRIRGLRLG